MSRMTINDALERIKKECIAAGKVRGIERRTIQRICEEHNIGEAIGTIDTAAGYSRPSFRLLSEADIKRIIAIVKKRKFGPRGSTAA